MLYDGMHRARNAGCLIETSNIPKFRAEPGRWRQILRFKLIFEDLPDSKNYVRTADDLEKPLLHFEDYSDYAYRGIEWAKSELPKILTEMPIEDIEFAEIPNGTEAHIIGGTPMGSDPEKSVVDASLVHHQIRNLVVLGSGTFPSCAPANPTLTLSAFALRSASQLMSSQKPDRPT